MEIAEYLATIPQINPFAQASEPLVMAAKNGHIKIVKFILSLYGEDRNMTTKELIRYLQKRNLRVILDHILHHMMMELSQ